MNTEDKLRRAAHEMNRVSSSVNPPPLGAMRATARMRNARVAIAAALGAVVLVGGSVLALRPSGDTTISPAGPGKTTTTTTAVTTTLAPSYPSEVDGISVLMPAPPIDPTFVPDGEEVEATYPSASTVESDVRWAVDLVEEDYTGETTSVVVLGEVGRDRVYLLTGDYTSRVGVAVSQEGLSCLVTLSSDGWGKSCGDTGLQRSVDDSPSGVVGSVVGQVPSGAGYLVVTVDDDAYWILVADGYAGISVSGAPDSTAKYVVLDADNGEVLEEGTLWPLVVPGVTTTTAAAAPVDPDCSGSGISPAALALSSVTQPVAETLWDIVDAARVCDFKTLAEVGGGDVHASFGGDEPADLWSYEEENGYEPMYWLLSVLDLPYGTIDLGDEMMYVWPRAATHDGGWDTMPEEYVDDLRGLYTEDDFESFRLFGDYLGYRVGITESGVWSFFVQGD